MKIKEETSKLVADCPKHRFEVVDKMTYIIQGEATVV
ncbi:chlorohydrolase [Streptococcus pneumoniae]|nr:chlorohydrolase [Streptococcus pneumoniae]